MGISTGPGGTKRKDKFSNKPKAKVSLKHLILFPYEGNAYASEASAAAADAATLASHLGCYRTEEARRALSHPRQAWVKKRYNPFLVSPWSLNS